MSGSRAPYMEWAKTRPKPEIDLAGSNLLPCTLDDLPGARDAVDIAGESPEGYPPLKEAIARHHGVGPERVATASGCSGATFLACAAILSPGDDVLMETPGYDPLPGAARLLGARVRSFERRFEDGYALDPDAISAALTPATRLVIISNPHNPSGALASTESLARLANLAEALGFTLLVDEVYRDTVLEDRPEPVALAEQRHQRTRFPAGEGILRRRRARGDRGRGEGREPLGERRVLGREESPDQPEVGHAVTRSGDRAGRGRPRTPPGNSGAACTPPAPGPRIRWPRPGPSPPPR